MKIEVKCISDVYDENEDGPFIVKRGVITKMNLNIGDIKSVCQIYNPKGRVYKTQCSVHHEHMGKIILNHKYEYISNLTKDIIVHGFKRKKDRRRTTSNNSRKAGRRIL